MDPPIGLHNTQNLPCGAFYGWHRFLLPTVAVRLSLALSAPRGECRHLQSKTGYLLGRKWVETYNGLEGITHPPRCWGIHFAKAFRYAFKASDIPWTGALVSHNADANASPVPFVLSLFAWSEGCCDIPYAPQCRVTTANYPVLQVIISARATVKRVTRDNQGVQ